MKDLNSVAFEIFGIEIQWYGVIITLAAIIGLFLAVREAERRGIKEDDLLDLFIYALIPSILGARLYYVIFSWDLYKDNPISALNIRNGGLAIHGGIITAVIIAVIFSKKRKISFWTLADISAPSLVLAQSIGRWGNYINQEAYGRPTDLPWGIVIDGVKVHPTFFYESLGDFLIFLFLLWYRDNKDYVDGDIFLLYIILYSVLRFFVEGLRIDSLMWGNIRVAQLISLISIGIGIYYMRKQRSK